LGERAGRPVEVTGLAVWAAALAVLALVDERHLVLPTAPLRLATVATGVFLLVVSHQSGDWRYLVGGASCAVFAAGAFGACALLRPRRLGFGDVRMAAVVALGAGALAPAATFAALCCAPVGAGVIARWRAWRSGDPGAIGSPVALGPFLALAGIVVVTASAL
jgi:leader peptidase (prepilin peptidase)/N-methyltransferase